MVRWLGLTLWRTKPGRAASKEGKAAEGGKPGRAGFDVGRLSRIVTLLWESRSSLLVLGRSFRRAVKIRRLSVDVTFGLGDPADTALAAGYIWSVSWIPNLSPMVSLTVHPDMENLRLEGSIAAHLRVRLFSLVTGFARAYLHRSFRSLIKEVRS